MPGIDDVAVERGAALCGRQIENNGTIPRGEESHEIESIGIGRQRLVLPIQWPAPIDDLPNLAWRLGQHLLAHQVIIDDRNSPYDSLDGLPLDLIVENLLCCLLRAMGGGCDQQHAQEHKILHDGVPPVPTGVLE